MSTKKQTSATETAPEAMEAAVINESPPDPALEPEAKEIPEQKPAEEDGFCVYLGPSIRGVIMSGTVYGMPKDKAVASLSAAVEQYPLIASLIVPGGSLPEARIKVKTPGNVLSVNYDRLVAAVTKK